MTDEGKGGTFGRKQARNHSHIEESLEADQERHPQSQIVPKEVRRPVTGPEPAQDQKDEKPDDRSHPDQTQFFPDYRKDEVGMNLRKIKKLLVSVAQTDAQ